MRFFKYLIFICFFICTSYTYAFDKTEYSVSGHNLWFSSPELSCKNWVDINNKSLDPKNQFWKYISSTETLCTAQFSDFGSVVARHANLDKRIVNFSCPSATEKVLKVPTNVGTYTCLEQCQYRIMGCVDIPEEPGMTCNAISSGIACKSQSTADSNNTANNTGNTGSNSNNDGSTNSTNSAKSESTSTNTSTSTSNTTTTNNTTNNTSTSTTTTTTTNNTTTTTNTTIDLSSLENTINNVAKKIIDAISKKDQDGSDTGTENGDKDGTDLTETNKKLDEISKNTKDINDSLNCENDNCTGTTEGSGIVDIVETPAIPIPDKQYFNWSASCPLSTGSTAISINGQVSSIDDDFTSWCQMAVDVRPFVLAAGAIIAFLVASGVGIVRND